MGEVARSPGWFLRAAWWVAGVLLVWAIAWVLVPVIAKSQIEKIGSEKLGRQVTVGAVDVKPWSLELTITDLAVTTRQPQASDSVPQLKIRCLYIDAEQSSLLRLARC